MALSDHVQFVGEVANDKVAIYYHAADYFVSASTSETQGRLTRKQWLLERR